MFLTRPISFFLVFSSVQLHLILASKIPLSSHPNPAGLLLARDTDSQTASAEFTKDDVFQKAVLSVTNTYRKRHNATGLKWNETLAETAGKWSGRCVFEHSGGSTGETLSSGYPNTTASLVTWGQESTKYDFKKGQFTKETGHFTQLVWKATTAVGCSRTQCDGKGGGKARGWFVVCEYYPARNVIGTFTQNVQDEIPKDKQPEGPDDPAVPARDVLSTSPQGVINFRVLWLAVSGVIISYVGVSG